MKDEGYVQKWHLRHKTSDISETKQSREKSLQSVHKSRVRPFDWRQSWLSWTLAYFYGEQIFFTTDISQCTFLWERDKIWQRWGSG